MRNQVSQALNNQLLESEQAAEGKRIELESGCYALLEEKVIKIFNPEATQLFGLNPEMIPFEQKPLIVALQLYMNAYRQGHENGYGACKKKVTEMLNLCL